MSKKMFFVLITAALWTVSCQSPVLDQVQSVRFGIQNPEDLGITGNGSRGVGATGAVTLVVSIDKATGGNVYTDLRLNLFNFSGNVLSENLTLPVGSFKLTKFILLDASDNAIYATPVTGSPKAYLVAHPLPLSFAVTSGDITTVTPEVVTTASATPGDFGYVGFDFQVVPVFDFLVQVQVPGATGMVDTTADITVKEGTTTYYSGPLAAGVNQLTVKDGGANYTVTISKANFSTFTHTYTTAQLKAFLASPLFVTLTSQLAAIQKIEFVFTSPTTGGGGENNWYVNKVSATGADQGRLATTTTGYPYAIPQSTTVTFTLSSSIAAGDSFAFCWNGGMSARPATVKFYDAGNNLLKSLDLPTVNETLFRNSSFTTPDTYVRFNHNGSDIATVSQTL